MSKATKTNPAAETTRFDRITSKLTHRAEQLTDGVLDGVEATLDGDYIPVLKVAAAATVAYIGYEILFS